MRTIIKKEIGMDIKIKVESITKEELSDILENALFGSSWLGADYDYSDYEKLDSKEEYLSDKLAALLLNGYEVTFTDYYAEGETYGTKCKSSVDEYEDGIYKVNIGRILETASTPEGYNLVKEIVDGNGDYYTADNFMQLVLFDEVIYG